MGAWCYRRADGAEVRVSAARRAAPLDVPAIEGKPVVAPLPTCVRSADRTVEEAICPDAVISVGFLCLRGQKACARSFFQRTRGVRFRLVSRLSERRWPDAARLSGAVARRSSESGRVERCAGAIYGRRWSPGAFAKSKLERISRSTRSTCS